MNGWRSASLIERLRTVPDPRAKRSRRPESPTPRSSTRSTATPRVSHPNATQRKQDIFNDGIDAES